MFKKIIYTLFIISLFVNCKSSANTISTDSISEQNSNAPEVTDARDCLPLIASRYTPWQAVKLSGKVKMAGLPIKPSTKIYMEKDKEILVSVSVPFMGEVGRIELTEDSIFTVNKMKNVYAKESVESLFETFDLSIGNLQDMILARVFTLEEGTLTPYSHDYVEAYSDKIEEGWYILPTSQPEFFNYGFKTYTDGKLALLIINATTVEARVDADYVQEGSNTQITLSVEYNGSQEEATLSYGTVDYNPDKMQRLSISSKWKKVGLKTFLKSF